MSNSRMDLIRLLAARQERLSVDSIWARRASGLRRSLVEAADGGSEYPPEQLDALIEHSFDILRKAAREIPDAEADWKRLRAQ